MRAPAFWTDEGTTPLERLAAPLLAPFEIVTRQLTARRLRRPGWQAPVPVICCGNVGVGGAGKTTLALDLAAAMTARGVAVHCLTRGYGGRSGPAPRRVEPGDPASVVGDEALLLAEAAPTWVCADRAAAARAACAAGAQLLLMDDGFQNPTLRQDWPLLVVDGAVGFGNGRLLPAGPLREPVDAAVGRAAAAILIGADRRQAAARLSASLPVLHAELAMQAPPPELRGRPLFAFAAIARPAKFFDALRGLGLDLADTRGFPDHHLFRPAELARLQRDAAAQGARLVTTPKDAVRLPPSLRAEVAVLGVSLHWRDAAPREALLDRMMERRR